jgi:uncharacterized membrane protein (DUF2068 family)
MQPRPRALRLIILYKLLKGGVVLTLALWLTLLGDHVHDVMLQLLHEVATRGPLALRFADWLEPRSTVHALATARWVAWLDGTTTLVEGLLLHQGHAWAEWVVVVGAALLIPFELLAVAHHPTPLKVLVLLGNAAIVAYLAWRRVRAR